MRHAFDDQRDARRLANWKPAKGSARREKAREDRREAVVIQHVRALCVERDGPCRLLASAGMGLCFGESEWAHLPKWMRSHTVNQPAEERHHTMGTLMLCTSHHNKLDGRQYPRLFVEHGDSGADGPMKWICGGEVYRERRV